LNVITLDAYIYAEEWNYNEPTMVHLYFHMAQNEYFYVEKWNLEQGEQQFVHLQFHMAQIEWIIIYYH